MVSSRSRTPVKRRFPETTQKRRVLTIKILTGVLIMGGITLAIPSIFMVSVEYERKQAANAPLAQFPVTVFPHNKTIVEDPEVNALLASASSPLQAAVGNVGDVFGVVMAWIAVGISDTSWYRSVASVAIGDTRLVSIKSGMRKEQVANAFATALDWTPEEKQEFLTTPLLSLPPEGAFAPGVYTVTGATTPALARAMVHDRFVDDVLSHYGPETALVVPLDQALTIASLIEREAGGPDDMRFISGVIWNRLFINMRLQIDATLQYAKANTPAAKSWWPGVVPADLSRVSPYNTYLHAGLPPTPIASPSVAAILAALNPKSTSCLFYFHDDNKRFHCTETYAEHVALLKQYYGRGK